TSRTPRAATTRSSSAPAGARWTAAPPAPTRATRRWPSSTRPPPAAVSTAPPPRARFYRDSLNTAENRYWSAYLGDTFTHDRMTLSAGLRYDRQLGRKGPAA